MQRTVSLTHFADRLGTHAQAARDANDRRAACVLEAFRKLIACLIAILGNEFSYLIYPATPRPASARPQATPPAVKPRVGPSPRRPAAPAPQHAIEDSIPQARAVPCPTPCRPGTGTTGPATLDTIARVPERACPS